MKYIHESFAKLKDYCQAQEFKGWDPYDGLNSKFFNAMPFKICPVSRLLWVQLFKRSPFNFRNIFGVAKDYNPKGLALFLSGYSNLYKLEPSEDNKKILSFLVDKLLNLKSKGYKGICWGYNFNWQSRSFFIPKYTPNVIVSTFAGNALIDAHQALGNEDFLSSARGVCDFILNDLNRTAEEGNFCFSYSPIDKTVIFNASLLASRFLSRVYSYTKEQHLLEQAKKSIDFCIKHQNEDGSWFYGAAKNQRWIDSFHTGYNLEAIDDYKRYTGNNQYEDVFRKGLKFYLDNFFTDEGVVKYYHDRVYPIDIHSISQFLVLAAKLRLFTENIKLVENVLKWAVENMQDKKEGYFYYQKKRYGMIKIPYIRWGQAWMFYALSSLLKETKE